MLMKKTLAVLCVFAAQLAFSQATATSPAASGQATPNLASAAFINPSLPIDQRVNDLISRMTLEEKVSQMRDRAVGIPRLGVPPYEWWNEGLHGVAFAGYVTLPLWGGLAVSLVFL